MINVIQIMTKITDFEPTPVQEEEINNVGQNIIKVVGVVGMTIAVIMLIVIGIKYMLGSAEERATYKKTMVPYVIGAILLFAASAIATAIYAAAITLNS